MRKGVNGREAHTLFKVKTTSRRIIPQAIFTERYILVGTRFEESLFQFPVTAKEIKKRGMLRTKTVAICGSLKLVAQRANLCKIDGTVLVIASVLSTKKSRGH